jgi:hypothetical protein
MKYKIIIIASAHQKIIYNIGMKMKIIQQNYKYYFKELLIGARF